MIDHTDLANEFRASALILRSAGWEAGASIWEQAAKRVEEFDRQYADQLLTLAEAAQESGYHPDSLSLLISQEKVPNAGKKGAPRIRRRDLPRRPPDAPLKRTPAGGPDLVGASLAR